MVTQGGAEGVDRVVGLPRTFCPAIGLGKRRFFTASFCNILSSVFINDG